MTEFDVCIVGGGMVGAALALGLGKQGKRVAIVETHMPTPFDAGQPPDLRVSAISLASVQLLESLGAWDEINGMRLCPYSKLSVWEKPGFRTDFNAEDIGEPLLGYFVENRILQLGLHHCLNKLPNVSWFTNARPTSLDTHAKSQPALSNLDTHRTLILNNGVEVAAKLIVAADGANSAIRRMLGIGTQGWQYQQHALGIIVDTQSVSKDITWQQFHPTGPTAFLPMFGGFASLIWYHNSDQIRQLAALNNKKLKEQIKANFPSELMDFEIVDKANFPLSRMHANCYFKNRAVLIGDAAHTINPLAGQGVNLGFKDVEVLLSELKSGVEESDGLNRALKDYESKRRNQNLIMMSTMDLIYGLFSNEHKPLTHLRNMGFKLANSAGPIKHQVMKYAMGIR